MERLKRNEEGVSPVIATILMVAITVVLAATLYMMVGDIGGDASTAVAGRITDRDIDGNTAQFEFVSLEQPSSAELDDVEITVLDDDGGEIDIDPIGEDDWSLLSGDDPGEVVAGSRFTIEADNLEDEIGEVVIRIDGYSGTISWEA